MGRGVPQHPTSQPPTMGQEVEAGVQAAWGGPLPTPGTWHQEKGSIGRSWPNSTRELKLLTSHPHPQYCSPSLAQW